VVVVLEWAHAGVDDIGCGFTNQLTAICAARNAAVADRLRQPTLTVMVSVPPESGIHAPKFPVGGHEKR